MRILTKLSVLAIFLSFLISGCEKDDPNGQTIEEQYPEWVNLTWMATDSDPLSDTQLDINIDGNTVTVIQTLSTGVEMDDFTSMTIDADTVTFGGVLRAEFWIEYDDVSPDVYPNDSYDYLLIYPLSGFELEIMGDDNDPNVNGIDDFRFKMN